LCRRQRTGSDHRDMRSEHVKRHAVPSVRAGRHGRQGKLRPHQGRIRQQCLAHALDGNHHQPLACQHQEGGKQLRPARGDWHSGRKRSGGDGTAEGLHDGRGNGTRRTAAAHSRRAAHRHQGKGREVQGTHRTKAERARGRRGEQPRRLWHGQSHGRGQLSQRFKPVRAHLRRHKT